jgi:hypothetical protein
MLRMWMLVLATLAAPAEDAHAEEIWTCNYSGPLSTEPTLIRFQVSGTTLIEAQFQDRYRILENNEYGLVATLADSKVEKDHVTVDAFTVVINKGTGEFWLATAIAGAYNTLNHSVGGICRKG